MTNLFQNTEVNYVVRSWFNYPKSKNFKCLTLRLFNDTFSTIQFVGVEQQDECE